MKLIDLYYHAFRAFRKHTQEDAGSQKIRHAIAQSDRQNDHLTSIKFECEIEGDWVENIEEGLVYVEKAIREDRQFIRTEGEVVPIEKVKKVSKQSLEHLSKHSNLITRAPEEETGTIIPEKMYVVEKLSDYRVYENRFIYMLLCYLKDFIQMRLDNIRDKITTFQSNMVMNKEIDENRRHIRYRVEYYEKYSNDSQASEIFQKTPMLDRVETIYAIVVSLLATPLMKEVSKAPLIQPPVVKINVLRMNQNFRAALALYDYVTAYNRDGYIFRENKKVLQPFPDELGDEVAETVELTSVLAFIAGNEVQADLAKRYQVEEKQNREAQNKKAAEDLRRLKKRIIEMNEDPAEYILKLEKRNLELEKENADLALERELNRNLQAQIAGLETEKSEMKESLDQANVDLVAQSKEIDRLNQKYFDDMTEGEEIHQRELHDLKENHRRLVEKMAEDHQLKVHEMQAAFEEKIRETALRHETEKQALLAKIEKENNEHREYIARQAEEHQSELRQMKISLDEIIHDLTLRHEMDLQAMVEDYEKKIASLKAEVVHWQETGEILSAETRDIRIQNQNLTENHEKEIRSLETRLQRLDEEKKYASAQYLALKQQQGLITGDDDRTSKEKFLQLESEMKAYRQLFKEQWKKTKQAIRESVKKDILAVSGKDEKETVSPDSEKS